MKLKLATSVECQVRSKKHYQPSLAGGAASQLSHPLHWPGHVIATFRSVPLAPPPLFDCPGYITDPGRNLLAAT